MSEKREEGFYWVKRFSDNPWTMAEMEISATHGEIFTTKEFVGLASDFEVIGPRITPPEEG